METWKMILLSPFLAAVLVAWGYVSLFVFGQILNVIGRVMGL